MVTPASVVAAAREAAPRLAPHIRRTPLEPLTDPGAGDPAWAKCEHLQVTGSFKVRGALNALLSLDARHRRRVVAASTGNHGGGLAYAGHRVGSEVTIYVPADTDPSKLASMRRWGAGLRLVDGEPLEAERAAREAAAIGGLPYISPYNDPTVIAGQATVGIELVEQLEHLDNLVVAVGGGGLISGTAAVVKERFPDVRVVGAAAANSDVMMRSVAAGEIVDAADLPTLSDGTAGGVEAGTVTLPLCQELVDDWVTVDEPAIAAEIRRFAQVHHQIIEGAAGVAMGAWRAIRPAGLSAVVTCGANIAPDRLAAVLTDAQP